ncbi:MAG TPA: carboxypeptidase-like regulatory domain-containing protein [Bryobacteraceae bacterium]|nr:carboxypeptidase-like regulatory domain-containing protein [Bryobacteraceae bacterium]
MAGKPAFQVFAVILLSAIAAAQDTYSISGSVVNSVTGEPVKNALVSARPVPSTDQLRSGNVPVMPPTPKTTFAGSAGEFEFTGLAAGSYQLSAQKPGFNASFADAATRPPRIEKLTASVSGVQIKLAPFGSIEGKITDQYGDPVPRAKVAAISVQVMDGYRTITMNRTVSTDDRGVFRIWNLAPGKYYIKATGKNGGTYMYVGTSSTRTDTWESFAPAYFGGGSDLNSATPLVIGAGTEARADMNLTLAPSFKIRGTVQNFTPHETVSFTLLQGDEELSVSRSTLNGTTGKFEIEDVIPGSYVLRAQQGQKTRGEVPVTVGGADVNDVSVMLAPPVTVQVLEQVVGPLPKASDDDDPRGYGGPPGCSVALHTDSGGSNAVGLRGFIARREKDGEVTIPNLFAGRYRMEVSCFNGYPLSIRSAGVDLLASPQFVISSGAAPAPIEITVKSGGGEIVGKLEIDRAPAEIGVLLVPVFSESAGPMMSGPGIGAGSPDFSFANLAPGDYLLYAVSSPEYLEFRNPAFLQSLTGGVSVKIEDGKTSEVTLTSIAK